MFSLAHRSVATLLSFTFVAQLVPVSAWADIGSLPPSGRNPFLNNRYATGQVKQTPGLPAECVDSGQQVSQPQTSNNLTLNEGPHTDVFESTTKAAPMFGKRTKPDPDPTSPDPAARDGLERTPVYDKMNHLPPNLLEPLPIVPPQPINPSAPPSPFTILSPAITDPTTNAVSDVLRKDPRVLHNLQRSVEVKVKELNDLTPEARTKSAKDFETFITNYALREYERLQRLPWGSVKGDNVKLVNLLGQFGFNWKANALIGAFSSFPAQMMSNGAAWIAGKAFPGIKPFLGPHYGNPSEQWASGVREGLISLFGNLSGAVAGPAINKLDMKHNLFPDRFRYTDTTISPLAIGPKQVEDRNRYPEQVAWAFGMRFVGEELFGRSLWPHFLRGLHKMGVVKVTDPGALKMIEAGVKKTIVANLKESVKQTPAHFLMVATMIGGLTVASKVLDNIKLHKVSREEFERDPDKYLGDYESTKQSISDYLRTKNKVLPLAAAGILVAAARTFATGIANTVYLIAEHNTTFVAAAKSPTLTKMLENVLKATGAKKGLEKLAKQTANPQVRAEAFELVAKKLTHAIHWGHFSGWAWIFMPIMAWSLADKFHILERNPMKGPAGPSADLDAWLRWTVPGYSKQSPKMPPPQNMEDFFQQNFGTDFFIRPPQNPNPNAG
jgi:hypothetical protein